MKISKTSEYAIRILLAIADSKKLSSRDISNNLGIPYKYVGKIEKVWRDAFGVTPKVDFEKGSKLAVETEIEFTELSADSIQNDDKDVGVATKGVRCGIGYPNSDKVFKEKMRVFLAGAN